MEKKVLLNNIQIEEIIEDLSRKVFSDISGLNDFAIVGIQTRGVELADRIRKKIEMLSGRSVPSGAIDITFHRDDLITRGKLPEIKETRIGFDISNKIILLVDDVLYTGRTSKAAIETLMTFGRPAAVKLLALVDRGNRELPLHADYCGFTVETKSDEKIQVFLSGTDRVEDEVVLLSGKE